MVSKISVAFLLLASLCAFAQQETRILNSTSSQLVFEYNVQYTDTSFVSIDETEYRSLHIRNGSFGNSIEPGLSALPQRIVLVGTPSEYGVTIETISSSYTDIRGKVLPFPTVIKKDDGITYEYESSAPVMQQDHELVTFGDFGISRGLPIQKLILHPVQIIDNNTIRLYTSIKVRVSFPPAKSYIIKNEDILLSDAVLNYDVAKYWQVPTEVSKDIYKTNAKNSVLSEGAWYRFEAPEEGLYRIGRDELAVYGIDAASVDPRTIRIYNNGGITVPEAVTEPGDADYEYYPEDLEELAITVVGQEDGSFDAGDYILFYGRGTGFWEYDSLKGNMVRRFHPYDTENFYWITSGGKQGKRITTKQSLQVSNPIIQETSYAYKFHDEDKINVGKTGRYSVGDEFSSTMKSRTYTTMLEGLVPGDTIGYHYNFVNASEASVPFTLSEHNTILLNKTLKGYGSYLYSHGILDSNSVEYVGSLSENRSLFKIEYDADGSATFGYLDHFEIYYRRYLRSENDVMMFYSPSKEGTYEYRLSNFSNSNIVVYDVSENAHVKQISNPVMHSGSEYRFQVQEQGGTISRYLAVCMDKVKSPVNAVKIENQNLRGALKEADYIIITHKNFLEQAERLANYRENQAKVPLTTCVVDVDEIYNEFSGGMVDVGGIRNFIRYAYFNWNPRPQYVFLFGDGDYDYKNLEGANRNFIPPYETVELYDEIDSYCTDDYYAFVDGNDKIVDLGIGRIPAQTTEEAKNYVDKVISYESSTDKGPWKNLITLVADDNTTTSGSEVPHHTRQSESLSKYVIPTAYSLKKIYMPTFETVQTSLGRRKPEMNKAVIDAMNEGCVLYNYIGHGSPELWAHERIFEMSISIPRIVNDKFFFLTAATCDFGYYDKTDIQSATEVMLLKENAGAIGAFTATRPVYSTYNAQLNEDLYDEMLNSNRVENNYPIAIGMAYYKTKLTNSIPNDRKFHLFADPGLRLSLPQYNARMDSVNGTSLSSEVQVSALSTVCIKGTILKEGYERWNDFSGEGILTVYDSEFDLPLTELGVNEKMRVNGGIIFRGRVSISNGEFSSEFVVPKDISYENENGKIVLYFFNDEVDGVGSSKNIVVGGTNANAKNDGNGPEIEIFFDNIEYDNTYMVGPNSTLLVQLNDETGLNTTGSGIGHKIEGILDDDKANPIDFSSYFTGDLDAGGKSGVVSYPFSDLEEGDHTLQIQAWDVFNNSAEASTEFKVVNTDEVKIDYVMNYPNPFSDNTTFTFQHNMTGLLNVRILIYTIAGRKIKELEQLWVNDRFVRIPWDGRDEDGDEVANGTYLYKVIVASEANGESHTVLGKLVIMK